MKTNIAISNKSNICYIYSQKIYYSFYVQLKNELRNAMPIAQKRMTYQFMIS